MTARDKILGIETNMKKVMVGCDEVIRLVMTALLTGGHVLLEDLPGTGKTTLAKTLARSLDMTYQRIQFTPDLLPTDITGLSVYSQAEGTFTFRPGPVFTNILLADEINRATPRTQSGLLECMEEKQVTADGATRPLPSPFFVIATQNPIETSGTFPLENEVRIMERFLSEGVLESVSPAADDKAIAEAREEIRSVTVSGELMQYIAQIVSATRKRTDVEAGVSPRGTLALLHASRSLAFLEGRNYVVPEDIKRLALPVLSHRLVLTRRYGAGSGQRSVMEEILSRVPVPTENFAGDKK